MIMMYFILFYVVLFVVFKNIIIIIIILFIDCSWVVTRWQWLFYMYTKYEIDYY